MEAGKYDKRKAAYKSTYSGESGLRSRHQQSAIFRKMKRDTALFAKRLRLEQENKDYTLDFTFDFSEILNDIMSNDITRRLRGLTALRQTLCVTNESPQYVDTNLVAVLSDSLIVTNENIQINAAWCLTNIAAGDYEQAREVLQAVPNIILVLDSDVSSMAVREQVCWTVGNIAGDCDQFRQVLLANGCLLAILRFLARCVDSTYMEGARTNAWALSNLMRGSTSAAGLIDSASFLIGLMVGGELGVAVELSWLFAFVTAKPEEAAVEEFLRCGLAQALTGRLGVSDALSPTTVPVVRALGNLTSGPIEWLDNVLSTGSDATRSVVRLTRPGPCVHRAVLKEALWLASNILGGRPAHRDLLLDARLCVETPSPTVFGAVQSTAQVPLSIVDNLLAVICSAEFDLQREALLALQNASAELAVVSGILNGPDAGTALLSSLVQLMRVPGDSEVVMASLRLVRALLESAMATASSGECGSGSLVWDAEGLTDAVDDIQYGQHEEEVLRFAAALADRLYEGMEGADAEVSDDIAIPAITGGLGRGRHLLTPSWMNNS